MYRIFKNNWHLLTLDSRISAFISNKPQLVARRAPNLKDKLVNSHFTCPKTTSDGPSKGVKGTFSCGHCNMCQFMLGKREFIDPQNNKSYSLKHFVNCKSRNVVYALICPCQKVYVDQASQELKKRIQKHLSIITLARCDEVALHFFKHHKSKILGIHIVGLDHITTNIQGG